MRLTDEILTSSDKCHYEWVEKAYWLAAAGRFGLIPSSRPFQVSVSINKGVADVEMLDCLAITRGGDLIDVQYDTHYTDFMDTRVAIPETEHEALLLVMQTRSGDWEEMAEGFSMLPYSFAFLPTDEPLSGNMFPIARIVNEYGWRVDNLDFVPPCLSIKSHPYYEKALGDFLNVLYEIDTSLAQVVKSECKVAVGIYWPLVQQLLISVDKGRDTMTPMELLGYMQKCVSAFLCACVMDECINLEHPEPYHEFVRCAYNDRNLHVLIKEGMELCSSIPGRVVKFDEGGRTRHEPPCQEPVPEERKKRRMWDGKVI